MTVTPMVRSGPQILGPSICQLVGKPSHLKLLLKSLRSLKSLAWLLGFSTQISPIIPVVPARIFVRFYFYLASYASLNVFDGIFFVTVGSYTLLNNFSPAQTAEAVSFAFLVKEYLINVDGQTLDISFVPSTKAAKTYAFVNGIEIVSMPDIYSSIDNSKILIKK